MEYVDGQSLRQRIQNAGTLAPELTLRIAKVREEAGLGFTGIVTGTTG